LDKPITLGQFKGSHLLVGFVFTRCSIESACPLTTRKMRQIQKLWEAKLAAGETGGKRLQLLSITLDPTHDTVDILKKYASEHGVDSGNWLFLTGEKRLVMMGLPSILGVMAVPNPTLGIQHDVKLSLIGPDLRAISVWSDNRFKPEEVISMVQKSPLP
jgi:protein SCO1/2